MDPHKTALERAFELAESGTLASVAEIRRALKAEGYFDVQLNGPSLLSQLRSLIEDAKKSYAARKM
jgi:hypothetical protein